MKVLFRLTTMLALAIPLWVMASTTSVHLAEVLIPTDCSDFNNGMDGWKEKHADRKLTDEEESADGTVYLVGEDEDNSSFIYNKESDRAWTGDLSCTRVCFDYRVIEDGQSYTFNITPSFTIFAGSNPVDATLRATFFVEDPITENSGWQHYCVDITPDIMPEGWVMQIGSPNQWQDLVSNVSGIGFTTDVAMDDPSTSRRENETTDEEIGVDNICISSFTGTGVVDLHLEDAAGNIQTHFCEGETIYLDGTGSQNESDYYIDVWKRPAGSNAEYTWLADQLVNGWVAGELTDVINLTHLFLNDPEGAIIFSPECEYLVKLAISNSTLCVPWTAATVAFTIGGLPVPEFHFEDANGNEEEVFCVDEDIIFNGTASEYEEEYLVSITETSPAGDENLLLIINFSQGMVDAFSITDWLEQNGLAVQGGYTYSVLLIVRNDCDPWETLRKSFRVEKLESPYFPDPDFCRIGNNIEITVAANNMHENHSWLVYILPEGSDCATNPLPGDPILDSGNQGDASSYTFSLPYVEGQCIIVKHGTWSSACPWWELRRAFEVPGIPRVDPFFAVGSPTPINNDNFYMVHYTANANDFPTTHQWTLQTRLTEDDPWEPSNLIFNATTPTPMAFQRYTHYNRVCHFIQADTEEFCSENQVCYTFDPEGEGIVLVQSDDGRFRKELRLGEHRDIDLPDEDREGGDRGEGDGGRNIGEDTRPGNVFGDEMKLYPNPANTVLNFRLNTEVETSQTLSIIDMYGRTVRTQQLKAGQFSGTLDVSALPSGTYLLRMKHTDGQVRQRRFVVQ